jgi:hypothetical protein
MYGYTYVHNMRVVQGYWFLKLYTYILKSKRKKSVYNERIKQDAGILNAVAYKGIEQ